MVDTLVLGTSAARHGGSSPLPSTKIIKIFVLGSPVGGQHRVKNRHLLVSVFVLFCALERLNCFSLPRELEKVLPYPALSAGLDGKPVLLL